MRLMSKMCSLNSPLARGYERTCSCGSVVEQNDGKLTSQYCGSRWCSVCNRIRSAQYISKYEPILKEWTDTQFVTLTVVNVEATSLLDTLTEMNKNFRRVLDLMRKRKIKIRGLIKSVDADDVNVYKEIFKYITKLFSKDKDGKYKEVNPTALDIIFRVMKGRRTLQPFGFVAPVVEEEGELELTEATDAPGEEIKTWVWVDNDWYDTGTGFRITKKIERMLIETGLYNTT